MASVDRLLAAHYRLDIHLSGIAARNFFDVWAAHDGPLEKVMRRAKQKKRRTYTKENNLVSLRVLRSLQQVDSPVGLVESRLERLDLVDDTPRPKENTQTLKQLGGPHVLTDLNARKPKVPS